MSWQRIRTDFRFAIITLFSAVTVLSVTPFAIYRFARGQILAGLVDVAIVLFLTMVAVHVWRGGDIKRASRVTVVVVSVGCVATVNLIGLTGAFWMYPVLLTNFLFVERREAMLVSALAIVALLLSPDVFADANQRITFLATTLIVSLFAFIFASRTETQRMQLENLASHDPLTGIYNRRAMERELAIAIEAYRRQRTPYGLAIADLDHFKRINDSSGHEAGDRVLVDFVELVARCTRKGDRFFRLGGEEFVLLLPGTQAESLQIFCEHLRERIATQLSYENERITVSIGAAALETDEDAASWLARADKAVYQAKHQGRNQVVVHRGREADADADAAPVM
ncbi:MAG: GGDEF domain-containing protein [Luteimonas sp.]